MPGPDREQLLRGQNVLTGIDFVHVDEDPLTGRLTLEIYFLVPPSAALRALPQNGGLGAAQIRITSDSAPEGLREIAVTSPLVWGTKHGRRVLKLDVDRHFGFSLYELSIDDPRVDVYFNRVTFSFQAGCDSDLDCRPRAHVCPPEPEERPRIDYRARDFWSVRRALLEHAHLHYPDWKDRFEADAGVMYTEALAALADEMAYYQDRVAREAHLGTASQRRSLRRHARLIDYDVHDGLAASTWLEFAVAASAPGGVGAIPAGADVWAELDDGSRVEYEVGRGLDETLAGRIYTVDRRRNRLAAHLWDDEALCLPAGSTEVHVVGHVASALPLNEVSPAGEVGRWALLRTDPTDPAQPARRWLVFLIAVHEELDLLASHPVTGAPPPLPVSRLVWSGSRVTPFELDLDHLTVSGNVVPATAGRTHSATFVLGPSPDPAKLNPHEAVERHGPNGTTAYRFSVPDEDGLGLSWHGETARGARPEVKLFEVVGGARGREWSWRRSLLGVMSSQAEDPHFTLEDGTWRRVVGYQRPGYESVHVDYASGRGTTILFGDGEFGRLPVTGAEFEVVYRLGNGRSGNVPADSIRHVEPLPTADLDSVTNPLPATGGTDPETRTEVRQLAPEAFRAVTYRAVRPEDYAEAAERLDWVQRAGAQLRWTGSWLSLFATPDPTDAVVLAPDRRSELERQLDRFRQAGREVHVGSPRYADIDLDVRVCVEPDAPRGDVEERIRDALLGVAGPRPVRGYFHPDNFTFGVPLRRSTLEAAIQAVSGVRAVEAMRIRRRGRFDWRPFCELTYPVAVHEVVRLADDRSFPERGTLHLDMRGGR